MVKRLLIFVASLLVSSTSFGSIVINEVMPKNVSFEVNDQFQFSGWAELYNSGSEAVDVASYFFSDSPSDPNKWQVPSDESNPESTIIPAKGFLTIYFDEIEVPEDYWGPVKPSLHANFKMPAKNGGLYMFDEAGQQVDRMVYDTTYRNISFGRVEDGQNATGYFLTPTRGASNNDAKVSEKQVSQAYFDLTPGFYKGEQTVNIKTDDASADIYYTIDGAEPTKEKGKLYKEPVKMSKNTVLRAAVYRDGYIPSDAISATYFINERDINLPVVSLISDPEYLYSDDIGILVSGGWYGNEVPSGCGGPDAGQEANYMTDWDRPANFEIFDAQAKAEHLNQEVKIGNFGACSRTKYVKSLKVKANKVYGDKELDYALFKEKPNLRWKSVVLRNSGNDFGRAYLRDGFMQTVACRTGVDHQAYQPSVVFLNGKYYGMLNIRERTNKDFVFSNYGYDEDEIYINVGSHANEGTTYDAVDKLAKLSAEELNEEGRFEEIDHLIDVNEFLDYFLAEIFCSNRDWPGGNIKAWKAKNGGKWRWILYDTDFGLSLYEKNYAYDGVNQAKRNSAFSGFIKNSEIRSRFLAKCCVQFTTTYSPERMTAILDSMVKDIDQEARVYERYLIDHHAVEGNFDDNIGLIRQFIEKRIPCLYKLLPKSFACDTATIQITSETKGATYKLNEEPIEKTDFTGVFYTKTPYRIEAVAPAGYMFDHWVVSRDGKSETSYDVIYRDTLVAQSYKAVFKQDASYDPAANHVVINEICTKNKVYLDEYRQQEDWIELYNAGAEDVNLAGKYLSCSKDTLDMYQFPTDRADLTVIPSGGYLVVWADKDPEQGSLHADFKLPVSLPKTILLSEKKNGKMVVLDSVTYEVHNEHQSYARFVENGQVKWAKTYMVTFADRNIPMSEVVSVASENFSISIYPNPVEEQMTIVSNNEETMNVKVVSASGMVVMESDVRSGEMIPMGQLQQGVYMLYVNSTEGSAVLKVVKK